VQFVRWFALTHVDQLRSGHIVDHEGKLCRVLAHETHMRGRAHTTITLELKDLTSGKNSSVRLRPSDKLEQVQLESEVLTYLYRDATSVHLMHPETFEAIDLPLSSLSSQLLPFLVDNSTVRCTKRGSDYLDIALPDKVRGKVVKAEGRTGGMKGLNDTGGRRVQLENGVWIGDVPNNVEEGDVIVVNTVTFNFVQKVDE